jgi:uncharacterized protein (TIGR02452 family)
MVSRTQRAQMGQETVQIIEQGWYTASNSEKISIQNALQQCQSGTVSYPEEHELPWGVTGTLHTLTEVTPETTLQAAKRLIDSGKPVVALNFASAKNPGGGFLSGSQAQEESLARSSGLYACLSGHPMYHFHRMQGDPLYSSYAIYSPNVPVFRDDNGTLLEQPYPCSFITAPAVNAGVARERISHAQQRIVEAMTNRVHRVLAIAAQHHHEHLVLGAWGCGVFRNDPELIAQLFKEALQDDFAGAFQTVVFAVLDRSSKKINLGPFERRFS